MRTLTVCVAVLTLWSPLVHAASIGLFADPGCTDCDLRIRSPSGSAPFYVAVSEPQSAPEYCQGITVAEFRVVGLPAGWNVSLTPAAGASAVGDPFGAGVEVSFGQPQPGDCVWLYTGTMTPAAPGAETILRVTPHSTPRDPSRNCPMLRPGNCGTPFCAQGGTMYVNKTTLCSVGIAADLGASQALVPIGLPGVTAAR